MSEIFEVDCARAQGLLPSYVDGDVGADDSAWLSEHLSNCAKCQAALATFSAFDRGLTGWGDKLSRENPPPLEARERLASSIIERTTRRRTLRWISAAAAAIAAGLGILAIAPRHSPPEHIHEQTGFVEIPYLAPLDPHENATVVRIQIRVATLISVGYRVAGDPDAVVPADVLVGEDGRAHAVRVPADVGLNGTGD